MKSSYIESGALISPEQDYRFWLSRVWDLDAPLVCFIGLNPSMADAETDDPTIRRMVGFARRWKRGGILVVNLFACRATDPSYIDPFHDRTEENDAWILKSVMACESTVACWGAYPPAAERAQAVLANLERAGVGEILCFGKTQGGHPKHPLYLANSTELIPFNRSAK